MVGIVVVSHSRALARAAVALAVQMLQGRRVPIVIAAGLDEATFGTDAVQIHEALVEADQDGDGVVVLMDLGSAVLSAELALELLADDARQRVLLCPAPLVEGLVAAAVTARSGAGRAEVAAEAVGALAGKQSQLASPPAPAASAPPPQAASPAPAAAPSVAGMPDRAAGEQRAPGLPPSGADSHQSESGRFTVTVGHGLHARPAARLVQLVQGLDASVELRNHTTGAGWVAGASLSRLATLGALRGHQVDVRAAGPQAREAVEQLLALARRNFDERASAGDSPGIDPAEGDSRPTLAASPARRPAGGPIPASPGIGIGPARLADGNGADPAAEAVGRIAEEPADGRRRLDAAIDDVRAQLEQIRAQVADEIGESDAAIFDTHLALLADAELLEPARSRIGAGQAASTAWASAVGVTAAGYESLTDPYLRARAADVRALGNQVSRHLLGDRDQPGRPGEPGGVLVAADLTPAEAATLDTTRVVAVVLAFGGPSAHSTILVRARGIPAVVGAGEAVLAIADGTPLAVDGTTGELVIDPAEAVLTRFRQRATDAQDRDRAALARAGVPATTRDGVKILVGANIGSIEDARAAAVSGADLVGLVRTEFLFLGRACAPDVPEQESVYRALAESVGGRRLTLRTLDVGGDKPLDYLPQRVEANPFLGVRGIRLALQRPGLLADQLLAMVQVAHDVPVSVMFPMVSTVDELFRARRILDDAIRLVGRGEPPGLRIGIMVEVPAAALKAAVFAPHLDFLSIGTNDLTQYTLAAERGNDAVGPLGDPLDPGVLRLIEATCRGAGRQASVAVCGELASDEQAVAVLIGLGVRELSVTPRAVPGVKQAVRSVLLPGAAALAARALGAPSAEAVHSLLLSTHL